MSSPIRSWATNGIVKNLALILQQPDKITIIYDQHRDVQSSARARASS
jgi:hypothetical protein